MCFTGSPGTGKTTVALRMAELLHRLGYLRRNTLVSVTRDDLVGQYIGHTAPKTREVLKRAMGGVLFIDEAYYLYRQENERDYGQETIEMLLQVMENDRDDLVVILAGYKDRMDTFFQSNPGMSSRIAHHLDFPDYTADELMAIARLMLAEQGYVLSQGAEVALADYVVGGWPSPALPMPAASATPSSGPASARRPARVLRGPPARQGGAHAHRGGRHPPQPGLCRRRGRFRGCTSPPRPTEDGSWGSRPSALESVTRESARAGLVLGASPRPPAAAEAGCG